jgi:hypothetical protein
VQLSFTNEHFGGVRVTGDARDEIIVWDPWEIWVYTQRDWPTRGKLYKPKRSTTCSELNYRATISQPGGASGPGVRSRF